MTNEPAIRPERFCWGKGELVKLKVIANIAGKPVYEHPPTVQPEVVGYLNGAPVRK